jgi:hypothetical protein
MLHIISNIFKKFSRNTKKIEKFQMCPKVLDKIKLGAYAPIFKMLPKYWKI